VGDGPEINLGKSFGQIVDTYETFRPDYPPEVFSRILASATPPRRTLVDLGVGTGKLARGFVDAFEEVIGVEPDAVMAEKLKSLEPKITVRMGTAENIFFESSSVDVVTIGHALHWMDPQAVLAQVARWLRIGGLFAICGGGFCPPDGPARDLVEKEFETRWAAFRDPKTKKQFPEDVLRSSPQMSVIDSLIVPDLRTLSVAEYVGYCRSTSHGNAYARSLSDPASYWRDFDSRLRAAQPDNRLQVDFSRFLMLLHKIAA
jgi:SAM-dependent methyltransferase